VEIPGEAALAGNVVTIHILALCHLTVKMPFS
jgi:hypothetical protein